VGEAMGDAGSLESFKMGADGRGQRRAIFNGGGAA
jgi:hypothetical protein